MSKYDFKIDKSADSSTGLILSKIVPGSTVLEFGCANGRMTRYMKEELSCSVYIVEYDEPAYAEAVRYAADGLCGDIHDLEWLKKFGDISFDAIIFADVLEHLNDPEKIVERAAGLLSDDGKIYISVPNITHNDIILKARDERFDYTSTGLLDDTHVHFWGLRNIEGLGVRCGLNVRSVEATYCETGMTEQYAGADITFNALLGNILNERECGEVYQFVVTLDKDPAPGAAPAFRAPSVTSHIYIDSGDDFGDECVPFESVRSADGSYHARFEINDTAGIQRVRFDPIENQGCILQNVRICQGGEELELIVPAEAAIENGYLFLNDDPMVYVQLLPREGIVTVEADILLSGEAYIDFMHKAYLGKIDEKNSVLAEKEAVLQESAAVRVQNAELERQGIELQKKIESLSKELESSRNEFGSYIFLANEKDEYAIGLERELSRLRCDVEFYENLDVVRWRRKAARVVKGTWHRVKRILRKLVGKGE